MSEPLSAPPGRPGPDPMAERYGRNRRPRWPLVVGSAIAVVALAWLAWAIWAQSSPKVTSGLEASQIQEHRAIGTLRVHLSDLDVDATCLLRAYARDHTPVGEVHFTITDPPAKKFTVTRTIRTERRATAVESKGCTAPGQDRPR